MAITNFEVFATRLRDEKLDVKLKYTIALELCESLELFQQQDYVRFVTILWPVIRDLLLKTPPVFISLSPEQKLRSTLLEVIQRIPHGEVLRPIALEIAMTLVSLVKCENEENAVLCLKIIYELHRMYRTLLENLANPFLDLATEIYRDADQMLKVMNSSETPLPFTTPNASLMSPSAMSPGPETTDVTMRNLNKATGSFKVMTEIPIIVVSIIQANRRHADPFINNILPLILHMLELCPKTTVASESARYNIGATPGSQQHIRNSHMDLITAQSKTLSFLAFFARGFTGFTLAHQDRIANLTLQLLHACPAEATATRKEMLIATRHIVSTDIRKAFVPIADKFLDMQVLVGSGLASQCILKPFAFSMLADLVHHIRSDLSPKQLTRMVDFYSKCMHDQSLSSGVHTMCAKLLHNITECIMRIPEKEHSRILLISMLKTFISSFSAIGTQATTMIENIRTNDAHSEEKLYSSTDLIKTNAFEPGEKVKELRFLLRSLVTGCKNVIYALKRCNSSLSLGIMPRNQTQRGNSNDGGNSETNEPASVAGMAGQASKGEPSSLSPIPAEGDEGMLINFELDLLSSLFREGMRACRIHEIEQIKSEWSNLDKSTQAHLSRKSQIKLVDREGKEQIEQFANLFVSLDSAVFYELFTSQFEFAFETMIEQCAAIASVQVFVASELTSPAFMSIMLRFLCNRLDDLGSDDEARTSTMLHLFKIAFLALTFYPEVNEPVLQPYVQPIISSALTMSKTAKKPENYFLLLRALFRSIGGGRYESLYKEVFPVLQSLLETLNAALGFIKHTSSVQELFVEICLTVPVRLSVLLPYLSLLMKPLVFALESGPELVSQGLRTLELCIDNLTREFLDPILTPVIDKIMSSLWLHLQLPSSASTHAPVAARILGKLGGRNRHILLTRFPSDGASEINDATSSRFCAPLIFEGLPGIVSLPLMDAITFSSNILGGSSSSRPMSLARKDAALFIMTCARYSLIDPYTKDNADGLKNSEPGASSRRLLDLCTNPMSLKRLANISSPNLQGSQLLESTIIRSFSAVSANDNNHCNDSNQNNLKIPRDTTIELSLRNDTISRIIHALCLACSHDERAYKILERITSLGAMQHIAQCTFVIEPELSYNPSEVTLSDAIPNAIAFALSSESESLRSVGCKMIKFFYTRLRNELSDNVELIGHLPAIRMIVSEMCTACYSPGIEKKRSGCIGITYIVKELDLGPTWLSDNLIEINKALLFTLKDMHPNEIQGADPINSRETIIEIIKKVFSEPMETDNDEAEIKNKSNVDTELNNPDLIEAKNEKNEKPATTSEDVEMKDATDEDTNNDNDRHNPIDRAEKNEIKNISTAVPAVASENQEAKPSKSSSTPVPVSDIPKDIPAQGKSAGSAQSNKKSPLSSGRQGLHTTISPQLSPEHNRLVLSFLALIIKELSNPSSSVRDTVKACLDILSKVTKCSITMLLHPCRDRLLVPIFGKPLRALPHNMQIGNIDAITYCLSLEPPFLEINDELLRLLSEALALADAEDQALVNHPAQVRSNTASLTHLRHVCIRMLTAAMSRSELSQPKHAGTRARIISVFFKSLYHKSIDVVNAANDGLKQVLLQQQKLPKDLLQAGLRPILLNLSDYKRLTVASLDGLARLLQLLTNYFKVEVGRKLLDHMWQWASPSLLQSSSGKVIDDLHEIKILVAILNVFHLLPPSASILLDSLVRSVVSLETNICRRRASPFRKPLFQFLGRYPKESVLYFMERINDSHYSSLFTHALESSECESLRNYLAENIELVFGALRGLDSSSDKDGDISDNKDIDKSINPKGPEDDSLPSSKLAVPMHAVLAIHACLTRNPEWFSRRSELLNALYEAWCLTIKIESLSDQIQHLMRITLLERITEAMLLVSQAMGNSPAVLFKLLEVAGRSTEVIDTTFIFQYVWDNVITKSSINKRREIITAFMTRFNNPACLPELNTVLLQRLINPLIATTFTLPYIECLNGNTTKSSAVYKTRSLSDSDTDNKMAHDQRGMELLRSQVLSLIHQRIWVALVLSVSQPPPSLNDAVRLELIQLTSILIRNAAPIVADLRKDIIKFGWMFIQCEDIMIKNSSYVLVSQFVAAFDTPAKIINQIYASLLRAHHVESRFLVRQALDILLPVLPVRLAPLVTNHNTDQPANPNAELPPWIRWAKRIIFEQGASVAHTTHIYQLIAGHPALFFPYRMQFATSLVGILQKMCLTHSATSETRTLALDIMDLFLKWNEMQEASTPQDLENTVDTIKSSGNGSTSDNVTGNNVGTDSNENISAISSTRSSSDLLLTESRRETIVGLLLRMLCLVFDFAIKSNLGPRALDLLSRYLDTEKWPPMHLRLTFFERSIQQIETQGMNPSFVLHTLTVLKVVTTRMKPIWFEEYYGNLVAIVRKCITVDNYKVQVVVASLLRQLYVQASENERLAALTVVGDLRSFIESQISENLQSDTNLFGTLQILHAVGNYIDEQFYLYIPLLMKYVQKYTKEHNSQTTTAPLPAHSASTPISLSSANSATSSGLLGSTPSTHTTIDTDSYLISLFSSEDSVSLNVDELVKDNTPLDMLIMLILLLRDHITKLGDQRRSFLTYIIQLIERSNTPGLLHIILTIVREWVMEPQDVFPTIKEKAMLMSSMMSFVHGSMSANDNSSRTNARLSAATSVAASAVTSTGVDSGVSSTSSSSAVNKVVESTNVVDPFLLLERKYLTLVLDVYSDPRFTRSEMTMRLEQAFLSGMQSEDPEMCHRFLETFDENMPQSLPVRLNYLLETQNWESVSSTFWLQQCLPLLFASARRNSLLRTPHAHITEHVRSSDGRFAMDVDEPEGSKNADANISSNRTTLLVSQARLVADDIIGPLSRMVLVDTQFAYNIWIMLFPLLWKNLSSKDQHDLTSGIIRLLAKPYHQSQTMTRPNVIQAILESCQRCTPIPRLPPQLLRYLGQTYCAWYSSLALLEHKVLEHREVESAIFDRTMGIELGAFDALTEMYTALSANHYFYGAWKRHCQYKESHIALAYEQLGEWANAQSVYEQAQSKARAGALPFSESEYCLWESRWVDTTKRLQNWDMLLDLGRNESVPELELEAGWRLWPWPERQTQIKQLLKATPSDFIASPRAKFYETYLSLIRNGGERTKTADFQRMCKEGIRLCLHKWNELPLVGTQAHIDVLHMFQLMVELGDASSIYISLTTTKADNLEHKSADLKSVLQTWRERLPNESDPINIWSDLVAWRQHIFNAINNVYVPFIPQQSSASTEDASGGGNSNNNSGDGSIKSSNTKSRSGTKGSSDTKNNRKNGNSSSDTPSDAVNSDGDVQKQVNTNSNSSANATSSSTTSYAYRGYHETAWIINRFAHVARIHGLIDVCISSLTRIYTLPNIEIQEAFLKLREQAKCYYDRSEELQSGLDVISNTNLVYFSPSQKAEFYTLKGQFLAKLDKLDEANHAFATGIQMDLGSAKAWAAWGRYNDVRFCNNASDTTWAVNAISCYMQAAGLSKRAQVRRYLSRTLWLLTQDDSSGSVCTAFDNYKSEMPTWYWIVFIPQLLTGLDMPYSRQALQILLRISKQYPQALHYSLRTAREESLLSRRKQTGAGANSPGTQNTTLGIQVAQSTGLAATIDELMSKLKTAHPLLTLSMESMIDQIVQRLKPFPEEDIYRLVHALLSDGLQQLHARISQNSTDMSLVDTIITNTCRVSLSLPSGTVKQHFEKDFGKVHEMDLRAYVTRLYDWEVILRNSISKRPRKQSLSHFSPFLVEFEQQKFEDVEVPGQYLTLTDNNDEFLRIERFMPEMAIIPSNNSVSRRLSVRGTDGSITSFAVQPYTSRQNHQEERWVQLYRNMAGIGNTDQDICDQRRLSFNLPTIVALAPHIRLVQEVPDSFTLQDVYTDSCAHRGISEISPAVYSAQNMGELSKQLSSIEDASQALFGRIGEHLVPPTLLMDDINQHSPSYMDYWLYRENFSYQIAVTIALTYIIASTQRTPTKFSISRKDGSICLTDLVPTHTPPGLIVSKEPVPFRLTPNIQSFITELGLEGILPFAIHKISNKLAKPEYLLRDFLDLYVRDEIIHLPNMKALATSNPQALAEMCDRNVQLVSYRAKQLVEVMPVDQVKETSTSPVQPVLQLMVQAVSVSNLSKMDYLWMPWL